MAGKDKKRRISPVFTSVLVMAAAAAVISLVLMIAVTPGRYDLKVGQVSNVTITATKDVVDTVTTMHLKDAAAAGVEASYIPDPTVAADVISDLQDAFVEFSSLGYAEGEEAPEEITQEMLSAAAEKISPVEMTETRLKAVMMTGQDTLKDLAAQTVTRVREHLKLNIAQGQENQTIYTIQRELASAGWDNASLTGAAADMLRPYLKANMLIDEGTTDANRQKAMDEVEDVVYIKGQNIVRSGEIVTKAQIEMLNSLGLLKEQGFDKNLLIGVGMVSIILMALMALYLITFERSMLSQPSAILLLMCILTLTVVACWGTSLINVYLMPAALGALMICYLMKPRLALMAGIVLAVPAALIATGASGTFTVSVFTSILTCLASGSLGISIIRSRSDRGGVILAGACCAAINFVLCIATGLITNANLSKVLENACWAAGSGLLSGLLCVGLQPIAENLFNLPTRARLNELANPNRPLMRRLLLEAPGTYHHSIMVANLAEAAANAIAANGVLCRVGAYYHDVGKLKRPLYFSENQMGDNPHDRTDPRVSAAIILSHPSDGVALASKEHLPQAVLNMIATHHGRTKVAYFLDKAIKLSGAENVNEADYTYNAPLPVTREEAVLMLADPVEAAARALPSKDSASLEQLVDKLTNARINNGDLNECRLTLAEIASIKQAFMNVLLGMYHERVEYPEDKGQKKNWSVKLFGKYRRDPVPETSAKASAFQVKEGQSAARPAQGAAAGPRPVQKQDAAQPKEAGKTQNSARPASNAAASREESAPAPVKEAAGTQDAPTAASPAPAAAKEGSALKPEKEQPPVKTAEKAVSATKGEETARSAGMPETQTPVKDKAAVPVNGDAVDGKPAAADGTVPGKEAAGAQNSLKGTQEKRAEDSGMETVTPGESKASAEVESVSEKGAGEAFDK